MWKDAHIRRAYIGVNNNINHPPLMDLEHRWMHDSALDNSAFWTDSARQALRPNASSSQPLMMNP
jgi:hypothetical protein